MEQLEIDFDVAKDALINCSWNVNSAIDQIKSKNKPDANCINILLVDCADINKTYWLKNLHLKNEQGTKFIEFLLKMNNDNIEGAFNIYRKSDCTQCITVTELSNYLIGLNL